MHHRAGRYATGDFHSGLLVRNQTAEALREAVQGVATRILRDAESAYSDELGAVSNAEALAEVRAFVNVYIPGGRPSSVAKGGPLLVEQTEAVLVGIEKWGFASSALAKLQALHAAHNDACETMRKEEQELDQASAGRQAAADEMERLESAARHYTFFVASFRPELGVDPRAIFPITSPSRRDEAAEVELDNAGAPPLGDGLESPGRHAPHPCRTRVEPLGSNRWLPVTFYLPASPSFACR